MCHQPQLLRPLRQIGARFLAARAKRFTDHIKVKIANAEQMKVHTMLVIGNRDMEANAVSVCVHGQGNLGAKQRDEVIADLLLSIKDRRARAHCRFALSPLPLVLW